MTLISTGDMSRHFQALQSTARVKDRMNTLGQELASGRKADVSRHLGGHTSRLAHLEHRSAVITGHVSANRELAGTLGQMQLALDDIQSRRADLAEHVQSLPIVITEDQRAGAATAARVAFETVVGDLNLRVADRSLFGGADTEGTPLADAGEMLADLKVVVAGATSVDDLATAVDDWFNDPAGGFATMGYLGDTGDPVERPLGEGTRAVIGLRADDAAFRDTLAAMALVAVLEDGAPLLDRDEANAALRLSSAQLLSVAQPLSHAQGDLGRIEGLVETANVRQNAERTALGIQRNEMISADPFETAAALQEVQTQLELSYMLTARLSNLSMAEYMR